MGSGRTPEARRLFRDSIRDANNPISLAKSLSLLGLSYLPWHSNPAGPAAFAKPMRPFRTLHKAIQASGDSSYPIMPFQLPNHQAHFIGPY